MNMSTRKNYSFDNSQEVGTTRFMSTRKNYSFDNSQEVGTTRFTITTTCIIIYLNTNRT